MSRSSGHRPATDQAAPRSGPRRRRFGLPLRGRREAAVVAIGDRVRLLVSGPASGAGTPGELTHTSDRELLPWEPDEAELEPYEQPGLAASRPERVRLRFAPTRSTGVAVGTVAVLVAAISFWWVLSDRPRSLAVGGGVETSLVVSSARPSVANADQSPASAVASSASGGGSANLQSHSTAAPSSTGMQIDVVGKVAHPGVVTVPAGARVIDAITAAGGALPGVDLNSLNLARRVSDGEQIAVGVAGASDAVPPRSTDSGTAGVAAGSSAGSSARVNLNSATATELDALPGVGPALAKNIVDWRNAHGRFASVDQLREVSGIGAAKFASLKNVVTV